MSDLSKRQFLKWTSLVAFAAGAEALRPAKVFAAHFDSIPSDVRDAFPLSRNRVYFNNGTLGPSPTPVVEAIAAAVREQEVSGEGFEARTALLRTRVAQFVGARPEEIALTQNTSEGVNIVAGGLRLNAGDEVILTTHEHVGGALPWLNRARIDGIHLRPFSPLMTGDGVLEQIESLITPRTRVVAIPHLSCTTGQVFPLAEIARLVESRGIYVFVDGAHGSGMLSLALRESGVHFYASNMHKWLCGPKGLGYLYVQREALDAIEPRFVGAYSDSGWSLEPPGIDGFTRNSRRFEYGTRNTSLYSGAVAAIDFFDSIGMPRIEKYGRGLASRLHSALLAMTGSSEVLTPTEDRSRGMMVTFRFRSLDRDEMSFANFASANGFRVRQVPEAGLRAIRVSTHLYNSRGEVDRFIEVVRKFGAASI